jgi:hypothetical protein
VGKNLFCECGLVVVVNMVILLMVCILEGGEIDSHIDDLLFQHKTIVRSFICIITTSSQTGHPCFLIPAHDGRWLILHTHKYY